MISRTLTTQQQNTNYSIYKWAKDLNRYFSEEDVHMTNKHTKECSTILIIKEMQVKTTMRYYFTPTRMTSVFNFYLFIYLYKFIYLFIYWLHWVFVAACRLSLVVVSGGYSWLRCVGFSLHWRLLLWSMGSRCTGFSSCGIWAQ